MKINTTVFDTEGTWTTYKNEIAVDGQIIGTAYTMVDSEDSRAYLEDIGINADQRNKGYGTEAINMLAEMHEYIYFAPTDEDNQRLYERIAEEMEYDVPEVDQGYGVYFIEK